MRYINYIIDIQILSLNDIPDTKYITYIIDIFNISISITINIRLVYFILGISQKKSFYKWKILV